MSPEPVTPGILRLLCIAHVCGSLAIVVTASSVFLSRTFLRLGLDMSQFGTVWGIAFLASSVLILLLSPTIVRLDADRITVAVGGGLRIGVALVLPWISVWTDVIAWRTAACAAVVVVGLVCGTFANTSLLALCRRHLPPATMGRHLGMLMTLWLAPQALAAVPMGWYLDACDLGTDRQFYHALQNLLFISVAAQVVVAVAVLQLPKAPPVDGPRLRTLAAIRLPFVSVQYRPLLVVLFALSWLIAMVTCFVVPYLLEVRQLTLTNLTVIGGGATFGGVLLRPFWGRAADRVGGRNIMHLAVVGMACGTLALAADHVLAVAAFVVLCWNLSEGIFGVAGYVGQQYLILALSGRQQSNVFIAAATFVIGLGMSLGSFVGGALLNWLDGYLTASPPGASFRFYFGGCGVALLLICRLVARLPDGHQHQPPHRLLRELIHPARRSLPTA